MTPEQIHSTDMLFNFVSWLLFLLSLSSVHGYDFTSELRGDVVNELKRSYHLKCVFLVTPDTSDLNNGYNLTRVKNVLDKLTHVSIVTLKVFKEMVMEFRCRENRPLYVLDADNATLEFLQGLTQIPSYPRWLLFVEPTTSMNKFLNQSYVPFNCEFLLAEPRGTGFDLTYIYKVDRTFPVTRSYYGRLSPGEGLKRVPGYLYETRNLQGLVLRVGAIESLPVVPLALDENKKIQVGGFFGQVWRILQQRSNFTMELTVLESKSYGTRAPNGSWDGAIAMVMSNKLDAVINDFNYAKSRMEVVDFLTPLLTTSVRMLVRKPDTMAYEWDSILRPFSTSLWLAIVACVFVIAGSLSLTHNVSRRYGIETFEEGLRFYLQDSLLCIYGLFCQQGPEVVPRASSCRCLYIVAGAVSIVFVAVYSATLTSFMTVQDIKLPFTDTAGLLKDGSYTLRTTKMIASGHFMDSNSEYIKTLYVKHMQPYLDTFPEDSKEGLEWLCSEENRLFLTIDSYIDAVSCPIVPLPEKLLWNSVSMIVSKGSPYRRALDYNIQKLRNTGVLRRLFLLAWPKPLTDPKIPFPEVSIEQALPIFGVIAVGAIFGAVALVLECAVKHWQEH